ncbi:hypothetical protein NL676_018752 [Syzygium grande]|nr:hypothetical protein NL676_018752 [Syzygium grande]
MAATNRVVHVHGVKFYLNFRSIPPFALDRFVPIGLSRSRNPISAAPSAAIPPPPPPPPPPPSSSSGERL